MKAHKLNLIPYKVTRIHMVNKEPKKIIENYNIKEVIPNIMCHPSLEHKGFRFHTVSRLAEKIEQCTEDNIILDIM